MLIVVTVHHPLLLTCRLIYKEAMPIYYVESSFYLKTDALETGILACLDRISTNHAIVFSSFWFRRFCSGWGSCRHFIQVKSTQGGVGVSRVWKHRSLACTLRENILCSDICLCGLSDVTGPSATVVDFMIALVERSIGENGPWGLPCKSCGNRLVFSLSTHVPEHATLYFTPPALRKRKTST